MGSQTFGTTELQAWETNFLLPPPSPVSPDFPRHWLVPTPDWQDIGGEWDPMGLDEVIP